MRSKSTLTLILLLFGTLALSEQYNIRIERASQDQQEVQSNQLQDQPNEQQEQFYQQQSGSQRITDQQQQQQPRSQQNQQSKRVYRYPVDQQQTLQPNQQQQRSSQQIQQRSYQPTEQQKQTFEQIQQQQRAYQQIQQSQSYQQIPQQQQSSQVSQQQQKAYQPNQHQQQFSGNVDARDKDANVVAFVNQMNSQDGSFVYGFEQDNGVAVNAKGFLRDGKQVIEGSYTINSAEGKPLTIQYVADENGYYPIGDAIPTPHPEIAKFVEYLRSLPPQPDENESSQNLKVSG